MDVEAIAALADDSWACVENNSPHRNVWTREALACVSSFGVARATRSKRALIGRRATSASWTLLPLREKSTTDVEATDGQDRRQHHPHHIMIIRSLTRRPQAIASFTQRVSVRRIRHPRIGELAR